MYTGSESATRWCVERVHFGQTIYPQLVALLAGCYVLERYRASGKEIQELPDSSRGTWMQLYVSRLTMGVHEPGRRPHALLGPRLNGEH